MNKNCDNSKQIKVFTCSSYDSIVKHRVTETRVDLRNSKELYCEGSINFLPFVFIRLLLIHRYCEIYFHCIIKL